MISIVNSWLEIGIIAYISNKQSVEDNFTEITSVKFVTELIEVVL
jgi:hypothetical protein